MNPVTPADFIVLAFCRLTEFGLNVLQWGFGWLPDIPDFVNEGMYWIGQQAGWLLSGLGSVGSEMATGLAWIIRFTTAALPIIVILAAVRRRRNIDAGL